MTLIRKSAALQWLSILCLPLILAIGGCIKSAYFKYDITDIQLYNVDNTDSLPIHATTGIVDAKAYAIGLQYTSQIKGSTSSDADENHFSLENKVDRVNIYSLSDFDGQHPAGASLNDYFLYGTTNYHGIVQANASDSISAVVRSARFFMTGTSFDGLNAPWTSEAYLLLMHSPDIPGYRTFVIDIAFADNTQFKDSISITLK